MASASSIVRFVNPLSRNPASVNPAVQNIVDQMNAYFDANPRIWLSDAAVFTRSYDEHSFALIVTLLLQVPPVVGDNTNRFGFNYRASYIAGDFAGGQTVTQKSNTFYLGKNDIGYSKLIMLDGIRPSRGIITDWILISGQLVLDRFSASGNPFQAAFAAPIGPDPILPLQSGPGYVMTATGSIVPGYPVMGGGMGAQSFPSPDEYINFNITNLSNSTPWTPNDRNLCFWDWSSGLLVGLPSCGPAALPGNSTALPNPPP